MIDQAGQSAGTGRSWIILGAALLAGFVAAGGVATNPVTGVILVVSVFVATFLGMLAHSILTEDPPAAPELAEPDDIPDPVHLKSV